MTKTKNYRVHVDVLLRLEETEKDIRRDRHFGHAFVVGPFVISSPPLCEVHCKYIFTCITLHGNSDLGIQKLRN